MLDIGVTVILGSANLKENMSVGYSQSKISYNRNEILVTISSV